MGTEIYNMRTNVHLSYFYLTDSGTDRKTGQLILEGEGASKWLAMIL